MRFLRRLYFCVRVNYLFDQAAKRAYGQQLDCESVTSQNLAMHDMLQGVYFMLLEEATHHTMKDPKGDEIYYYILDDFYDKAVKKYII